MTRSLLSLNYLCTMICYPLLPACLVDLLGKVDKITFVVGKREKQEKKTSQEDDESTWEKERVTEAKLFCWLDKPLISPEGIPLVLIFFFLVSFSLLVPDFHPGQVHIRTWTRNQSMKKSKESKRNTQKKLCTNLLHTFFNPYNIEYCPRDRYEAKTVIFPDYIHTHLCICTYCTNIHIADCYTIYPKKWDGQ